MALRNLSFTVSAIATAAGGTVLCTIPTGEATGENRMGILVTNTGANAWDAFWLKVRVGNSLSSTSAIIIAGGAAGTTTADFSPATPTANPPIPMPPIIRCCDATTGLTIDPTQLAAAGSAFILIDTAGIAEVQLRASASVAVGSAQIDVSIN